MFQHKWIAGVVLAAASMISLSPVAQAQTRTTSTAQEDETFLAMRDASRRDDSKTVEQLAARLGDYMIPSYIDYYRLKPRLRDASPTEIRAYLLRYDGSAIADRLRNDWLLNLARARDWVTFDEQYPLFALDDDTQLKCYALMSRVLKGQPAAADARALLTNPKEYGEGCAALIPALVQAGQFSATDVWAQIRLAAETNTPALARRLAAQVDASESAILIAFDRPEVILAKGAGSGRTSHEIFLVALGRAAKTNPDFAVSALTKAAEHLNAADQAQGWAQIAFPLSFKLAPEAIVYWRRTAGAPLTEDAYQWKVRMALRAGDWKLVKSTVDAMPAALRKDPAWIYWVGRALKAERRQEDAQLEFQSIATQTNFYGQLALEELGKKITIPPRGLPITSEEIATMAENAGFRRAFKFFDLNLRFEGYREWNWELRKMSERQHLAAAEFARQSNVLDRMVNTSDRTKAEFDFTQRFPTPFRDTMVPATQSLNLDMAWVYGLIRQESRFIMNARSHVGASGLMQLMPATAKYVAKKIGMTDFTPSQVNDVDTNIQLGTNYLNMVLNDLEGSQAMASAAYNAGPGRPRAWRSTLTRSVEGAIFAESIPFNETRGYVKNVLSNATYYAALFEGKPQSLKARLGNVAPKGFIATELP